MGGENLLAEVFCLITNAYFYSLCMTSFKQLGGISIAQNLVRFLDFDSTPRRLH